MERHEEPKADERPGATEDELGRLIRWSLKDSLVDAEPSSHVWPRILARVRETDTPQSTKRAGSRRTFPTAPLIQAVIISGLLLAFGLGVDRDWSVARGRRIRPTPFVAKATLRTDPEEDMLRARLLFRKQPESLSFRDARIAELEIPE